MEDIPAKKEGQSEPVYLSIAQNIVAQINEQTLKSGEALPSEFELSQQYKVSRTTIRKAIAELVRQGKLVTRAGKGTFISSGEITVSRDRLRRKILAYVVPDIADPFVAAIHEGITAEADKLGYRVTIYGSNRSLDIEEANIRLLVDRSESGAIIFPTWGKGAARYVMNLKRYNYPFVLVDRSYEDVPTDYLGTDNFQGAFDAVSFLIKNGHRRIGHIRGIPVTGNIERYRGYIEALTCAGIQPDENLIVQQELQDSRSEPTSGGIAGMRQLMSLADRPTAVFAVNDAVALDAERVAMEMGMKIGRDVAIVGFDDLGLATLAPVPLTTVRQPAREIGQTAVRVLVENITAPPGIKRRLQQFRFAPELVVRESARPVEKAAVETNVV